MSTLLELSGLNILPFLSIRSPLKTTPSIGSANPSYLYKRTRELYGYETLFVDDSGNWFSLGEKSME